MKKVSDFPKRYYGLHFSPGVVEYPAIKKRVFVAPGIAKEMDATFTGKPLFVEHRDDYEMQSLPTESDGVIVKSFYNIYDGNHWVEFLATTDDAQEKIADGWLLSNSYKAQVDNIKGESKNVSYDHAVTSAEYHHMGLIKKPRYENSVIYTPEQFKEYNENLKAQLEHLQNSKEEDSIMFFNKTKAKDADTLKDLSVVLPKSKVEKTVMQLINEADESEAAKGAKRFAADDDVVKVGEEEVSVKDLVAKILELTAGLEEVAEAIDDEVNGEGGDEPADETFQNEEDKKKKELEKKKLDNAKSPKFSSLKLKNASDAGLKIETEAPAKYSSMASQIQLGKDKY